jgi:putative Mg2+ transporter-C (MgtC) family protein
MLDEINTALLDILWRTALAALLGYLIGWERRATGSPMRARTLALVTMTSTALTALSVEMAVSDISRVLAGLLTGIGFIGAGVVMRDNATGDVRGLTTAASLWSMSAAAIAIGAGFTIVGLVLTLFIYLIIAWDDWPIISRLRKRQAAKEAKVTQKD